MISEVRDHGVGFYKFSQEEEQRQAEMERLADLRQQVSATIRLLVNIVNVHLNAECECCEMYTPKC